jgi:hypothetical protein
MAKFQPLIVSAGRMSQSLAWLLEDPIAVYVSVGIAVSIVQHYREMGLIDKRSADLAARMQRLEILMRTTGHSPAA